MGEPSGKRSLHLRLEARLYDELQQLAGEAGSSIADLVRELLERALRDRTHLDILTDVKATGQKLDRLAQAQAGALTTLQQRLGTIEQLICSADANAASRYALDFARHYDLFKSTRYGIWELQTIIVHVLEYAMLTHGNSREVAYKFHADCQDASSRGFKRFRATVEQDIAAIDAGAPAPLQPPPAPELTFACRPSCQTTHAEAGDEGALNPAFLRHPLQVQPHAIRTATALPATRSGRGRDAGHRPPSKPSQRRLQPWLRRAAVPQPQHGPGTHLLYRAAVLAVAVPHPRRRRGAAQPTPDRRSAHLSLGVVPR